MTGIAWLARAFLLAFVGTAAWVAAKPAAEFDLVVRNGRVIDGTGNASFRADVGIRGGSIVFVGRNAGAGEKEIDAKGLIVAPGFIDVHTHAENVQTIPNAENFVRMGVTSVVIGNCGNSELDTRKLFENLEAKPVSINVASLVGHNAVRRQAMGGNFNRPPTGEELEAMRKLVREAMLGGAVGLSTGLIYLPGTYSKTEEIVELAKVAAQYGGLYASHMRNESSRIEEAIDELLAVLEGADCRGQLSHIKLGGENMWGKADRVLAKLETARKNGVEITQDQYAYTASSTSLSVLVPDRFLEGGPEEFRKRLADASQRTEMVSEMKATLARRGGPDYGYVVIASCRSDRSLNGKNIRQITKEKRNEEGLDAQIDVILSLVAEGGANCVFHGMSEPDVVTLLRHPNTMVASDASVRAFGEDIPHPRGYGNNARVLQRYVREQGVLRLEDAIRKMTSLPAQTFRLRNRGLIREGMAADLAVFDPESVKELSTYTEPHRYASGFRAVIVNGRLVVENDKHTGARPGTPLRGPGFSAQPGSRQQ